MNLIGIPYRRLRIDSLLSADEFVSRLKTAVVPKQSWFKRTGQHRGFIGKVSKDNFRLTPSTSGRNTYLPWILGNITPVPQGARIDVILTLHPVAAVIMLAFFLWAEFLSISKSGEFNTIILFAFIAFHLLLYFIGFLPEAGRSEQKIKELAS